MYLKLKRTWVNARDYQPVWLGKPRGVTHQPMFNLATRKRQKAQWTDGKVKSK
jgi:hypothetical protein